MMGPRIMLLNKERRSTVNQLSQTNQLILTIVISGDKKEDPQVFAAKR